MSIKRTIVVVEDDLDFAKLVKIRLERVGYRVLIAVDTYLGMRDIVKNEPDLVVLDLMMPAGGGLTLLERIRQNPATITIPVVILTGKTMTQTDIDLAKSLEVEAIFTKPYEPAKFVEKVMAIVPA